MTIQISERGSENILKYLVGFKPTTETVNLKLYSSNTTPDSLTGAGDLTEVTGGGYTPKILGTTEWTVAGSVATTSPQVFTFTAGVGQIYGYYLVGNTSGMLIASERFSSGPFNITTSGDSVTVTATISVA